MNQVTVPALVIRRTFAASPQRVYDAWTTPGMLKQFMAPEDITVDDVELDLRTGGTFRIGFLKPDGEIWYAKGAYREISPARRLSMTWIWEEDEPSEERETLLTLEFQPLDGGTEFTLRHELLASEESRTGHERGWNSMLEKLTAVLSA